MILTMYGVPNRGVYGACYSGMSGVLCVVYDMANIQSDDICISMSILAYAKRIDFSM